LIIGRRIKMANLLFIILMIIIIFSQMYMFRFDGSEEGKDERGKEIQRKRNNLLYGILYLGIILVCILVDMFDVFQVEQLPTVLLMFVLSLSIIGSIYTYVLRNRRNY
jgi:cell division protein FtsW (lipid II flippase)